MLATGLQGVRNYKNVDNPVLLDVARGTSDDKIVFIMVGLPARGKTHTARRLARCVRRRLRPAAARVSHADAASRTERSISVRRGIYPTPTRWQFQYAMRREQPFYAATRDRGEPSRAERTHRYLSFVHAVPIQIFNVGDFRRRLLGQFQEAEFFRSAARARTRTRAHTRTQRHDRTRPCRGHPTTATLVYGSISHQRCVTNHAET
jgi:hypothetical protein